MEAIYKLFLKSLMISGFVFVMMVMIEYINVQTKGIWARHLTNKKWVQYIIAGLLGASPGCLGAFTVVALFSHRLMSFGAVVTTMIATSGDETFVMFALFPKQAAILTAILFVVGVIAGWLTDTFYNPANILGNIAQNHLVLHDEKQCDCFQKNIILDNVAHPSIDRLSIAVGIIAIILGLISGAIAGKAEMWVKVTLMGAFAFALFIVITVPDHFLKEHIYNHIVKIHLPRIFLWVFGVLIAMHYVEHLINVKDWISSNSFIVLLIAVLIGIIPESGPHLIFVTLFFQGALPFSILLANSISQDGHGMLPMLAESQKAFWAVKIINIAFALLVGGIGLLIEL